jgi:hypothetical protein
MRSRSEIKTGDTDFVTRSLTRNQSGQLNRDSEFYRRLFVANQSSSRRWKMCHTLTLLIPRSYNPDRQGRRRSVESKKLEQTVSEMRHQFPGYTVLACKGWDGSTRVEDSHLRFEVDLSPTRSQITRLRHWKRILQKRFKQAEIYMRLSTGSGTWV